MATQILGKVGIVFKDEYNAETIYNKLDVVRYQGSAYSCKVNNVSDIIPTNQEYWTLIVEKGYTPIKEIDYWTVEDKTEMEEDVIEDITPILDNKADKTEIPDVSDFITKDVNNLTNYELKTNTGTSIELSIDSSTYEISVSLKNSNGDILNTQSIDLPLETMVIDATYNSQTKEITLILKNGNTVSFSVADLISGLQTEITSTNKLLSDLVDDTNQTNKFVTTTEKETWNNKSDFSGSYEDLTNKPIIPPEVTEDTVSEWGFVNYYEQFQTKDNQNFITDDDKEFISKSTKFYIKPNGGIPKSDLENDVQTSLNKANTALQEHQDISGKVDKEEGKGLFSGDYNDLTNKPDIPSIPTKVSAFDNDAGYLTTHQDISGKENSSNKVISLSASSTDQQYPSAKCVYNLIGNIETILTNLTTGGGV